MSHAIGLFRLRLWLREPKVDERSHGRVCMLMPLDSTLLFKALAHSVRRT